LIASDSFSEIVSWVDEHLGTLLLAGLLAMEAIHFRLSYWEKKEREEEKEERERERGEREEEREEREKEREERHDHVKAIDENIKEIKDSTEQLTREEYELLILRGILTAEKRIYCYWHSLHPVAGSENYKKINTGLMQKTKEPGVTVQVVVASDPSRIAPAYELVKEDVDVRFKNSLTVSDLRFSLFDEQMCVIGVPETSIPDGKPSKHGVDTLSRKMNALLAEHFEQETSKDTYDFYEFVALQCCKVLKEPTNSVEMVAEQLRVDKEVIERACQTHCNEVLEEQGKEEEVEEAEEDGE
jgi:hypothetical protein